MVELWFPSPIYYEDVAEPEFSTIQSDFQRVFDDLIKNKKFQYVPDWNSHLLSDITFEKNLVEEYNLTAFKAEVNKHVKLYLKEMQFPEDTPYKFENSWMTLYQKRDYAHVHSHGSADMSGVYYFKTTGTDGNIFFENPVKPMGNSLCYKYLISRTYYQPKVGRMMLFPSWLEHGVQTMIEDGQRVSISFNLIFER